MKVCTRIENISYRVDFGQNIDIDRERALEEGMREGNLSYIYASRGMDIEMLIYPSGEVLVSGAKNMEEIESSFWDLKNKLKSIGTRINLKTEIRLTIENILATANVRDYLPNLEIDLERIGAMENTHYRPESFPGVFISFIFQSLDGLCDPTVVLFPSGRVLIGDVTTHDDANLVLEKIIDMIRFC